jgi:hypothetical protein
MISWGRYSYLFVEWFSLGGVIVLGDAVAQKIEYDSLDKTVIIEHFKFDKTRSAAMAATGLAYMAPLTMAWFPFLHRFMAAKMNHLVEGTVSYIATKVILENSFLAFPVCIGFFVLPPFIEGGEQRQSIIRRIEDDFVPTLWTDVAFWTCMSPINYKFVALKYQAAFSCTLGAAEAAGLSYLTHIDGFKWPEFLKRQSQQQDGEQ